MIISTAEGVALSLAILNMATSNSPPEKITSTVLRVRCNYTQEVINVTSLY